jgi:predicted ATPase
MISGDLRTARDQAGNILALAEKIDDPGFFIEAHHLGWSALTFTGDFAAARRHAEQGRALYDRGRDHRLTYRFSGHDPGMCCRSFGSLAAWQLGFPDTALAMCRDGLALAEAVSHPFSVTIALWGMGILALLRRDSSELRVTGETMIAHCQEKGFAPFIPVGKIFRGGALAAEGSLAQGVADIREGIAGVRSKGTEYTVPTFLAWMAALCLAGGQMEQGVTALEEGLAMSEKNADRFSLPEFHRLKGELLLAAPAGPSPPPKPVSGRPSRSRARRTARCSSCARPRAWHASGGRATGAPKLALCWPPSAGGSPRGSRPRT